MPDAFYNEDHDRSTEDIIAHMFGLLDTDGDAFLSFAEFSSYFASCTPKQVTLPPIPDSILQMAAAMGGEGDEDGEREEGDYDDQEDGGGDGVATTGDGVDLDDLVGAGERGEDQDGDYDEEYKTPTRAAGRGGQGRGGSGGGSRGGRPSGGKSRVGAGGGGRGGTPRSGSRGVPRSGSRTTGTNGKLTPGRTNGAAGRSSKVGGRVPPSRGGGGRGGKASPDVVAAGRAAGPSRADYDAFKGTSECRCEDEERWHAFVPVEAVVVSLTACVAKRKLIIDAYN